MAHLILIGDLVPHNYAWIETLEQKECVWILQHLILIVGDYLFIVVNDVESILKRIC
jgi:hypothetical protein